MEGLVCFQRRTKKAGEDLEHKSCEEWFWHLGSFILEKRRLRDKVMSGHRLDLIISKVFPALLILCVSETTLAEVAG